MEFKTITTTLLRPWLWGSGALEISDLDQHPVIEFAKWYKMARLCFWLEFPDACIFSSVDKDRRTDSRVVLLREFDTRGFVFFTNYLSVKSEHIALNPHAAMNFFWDSLQRQIRIKGRIEKTGDEESDRYFRNRPRESQIGAWASKQSKPLSSRGELESRVEEFSVKFKNVEVPRPENWGGYRLVPEVMEFWKLRPARLHDRFRYSRNTNNDWDIQRLYP